MRVIDNMSIRKRLMTIFFTWVCIFLCFGFFEMILLRSLSNTTKNAFEEPLKISFAAVEARADVIKINKLMTDLVSPEEEGRTKFLVEDIKALDQKVQGYFDILIQQDILARTNQLCSEAYTLFRQWYHVRQDLIAMVLRGEIEEASGILTDQNNRFADDLEQYLIQIEEDARTKAEKTIIEAESTENTQRSTLTAIKVLMSFMFFLFFILIINSIVTPVNALKKVMNTGTNINEFSEVVLKGKNEIADMANYYNSMMRKLKELFWIKDGENKLNQELSGYASLEELAQKAIIFLARSLNAGKGVLYIWDADKGLLHLEAAYAFSEKDKLLEYVSLGEGTIGQVGLEGKPIILECTQACENLILTGTVTCTQQYIFTFPLLYENELYGVIELASFEAFDEIKKEFINGISGIIAINLHSAIKNQRIKNLLQISEQAREETRKLAEELGNANVVLQEQQEMLQHQTGELQQTNVELEEQQLILQQQSEELQQTNAYLEEQQQQLEEQAKLLNIQNKKLEESNRYKSEFLANMSHELRTPLNSVILLSKLMMTKTENTLHPKDMEKIRIINQSGQELLRLIDDILDLSRIEAGKMSLSKGVFRSEELLKELVQMFDNLAREKKLAFSAIDKLNGRLFGDQHKISQILRNFISNAIKFTAEGSVRIEFTLDGETDAIFTVKDTGIGIAVEQQNIIFEEFQQADGSISRKYGGSGLGLSISKKMADLMGGEIRFKSEPGVGSEFSLYLPGAAMPVDDSEKTQPSYSFIEKEYEENRVQKSGKTILLIEDDIGFAGYIQSIIESMGFQVLWARNGMEGLKLVRKCVVNGILLDLNLPDVNGIDVLKEIKSTVELRKIPVHILSMMDKDYKALKLGAIGYCQKPISEQEVIQVVTNMIAFSEKTPKDLLVVEDNPVQQKAIVELIEGDNIRIRAVAEEKEAMTELQKRIYDAVILDLELEKGNGMNICRFIHEQNIEIPVIVYTGKSLTVEQEKEIRRYADSVIIKTANSESRLMDEVMLFLHNIGKDYQNNAYLLSRAKQEWALNLDKKTIMIVDDDPRNIFVLASALEDHGARIIEADHGEDALKKLEYEKVDLILMDIMMPVMDGYEAIREIRKQERFKDLPIIALTAKSLKGDREKCIEVGANDYISKPVDYDVMLRLVKAWISKQ